MLLQHSFLVFTQSALMCGIGHAAPVKTEHVLAELVPERTALVPGKPATVALRLKMADGWHTYWRNPGDSGLPTTHTWQLPDGETLTRPTSTVPANAPTQTSADGRAAVE